MKKLFYLFFAVIMSFVLLSGNAAKIMAAQSEEESSYCLYYLNAGETELVEEPYSPEKETSDFMVQDLQKCLEEQISDTEKIRLLPEEVVINSCELQDGVLVIDFNRRYLKVSRAREILTRAGIVKTFLQIPGVQRVRFTVLGEALMDSKNKEIGDMTADTFLEYTGKDMNEYRYETFTLYFTDQSGEKLVEEQRNVYYKRTLSKERVVLEQLAKGPMEQGNYPTIPGEVETLSVMVADRICYVDLNSSFQESALEISEQIPIYSVVNSLLAVSEADKVQISIDGNTSGMFGQNMPLYNFYEKNEELILRETVDIVSAES